MERAIVRVKETQADLLLSGFRLLYAEYLRTDLEPIHRDYVEETLNEVAKNCVNQGLGYNIAKMQHEMQMEQKLLDLKVAWDQIGDH